jgi:MYXO-CTERM domain-containing protein
MGNHEGRTSTSATQIGPYYEAYVLPAGAEAGGLASGTEAYYSFDYGTLHVIVMDSHQSSREPGDAMLTWLEADLAATAQEWVIASWHHPPYTKGSHDSDTESLHIDMRENALPILEAGGVDLVLGGHSHIYERSHLLDGATQTPSTSFGILDSGNGRLDEDGAYQKPSITGPNQGAVYVVAGHGGSSVSGSGGHPLIAFDEVANGSVILDLHANRLQITNIRYDGVVTDEVALVKGEALIVTSPDGGEHLESGTTHTVTWATVGNTPTVNVSWTCDEGQSWIDIATGIANTGSTNWTIPLVQSEHALVRVTSSSDANTWDESNGGFRTDVATTEQQAISYGATWSYHDQGVDLGGAWLDPAYNDSSWSAGPGQLGYGDGDEATLLQDADPNAPSAYFRHVFDIAGTVTAANLQALYDDGIAVWINATQVLGVNVDNGTDYSAWSSAQSSDNSVVEESLDLANNPFVEGQNVVAAMVKQRNGSSSDLSFDLSLSLTVRPSTSLQSCAEPEPEDTGSDTGSDTEAETGSDTTQETGEPTGDDTEEPKSGDRDATGALAKGGCGCSIPPPTPAWPVLILLAGLPWLRRRGRPPTPPPSRAAKAPRIPG